MRCRRGRISTRTRRARRGVCGSSNTGATGPGSRPRTGSRSAGGRCWACGGAAGRDGALHPFPQYAPSSAVEVVKAVIDTVWDKPPVADELRDGPEPPMHHPHGGHGGPR
jgi:hypothetical protein